MPIPGVPGLVTVTGTVPAVARSEAAIVAVNWFPLTWVVVWAAPLKFTTAVAEKLDPLTVKTNAGVPWLVLLGASWLIAGMAPGCAGVGVLEL